MPPDVFDVIIVGAGPAGATTALNLLGSGLKVALVDKSTFPRRKICGDALSGSAINVMKRLPGDIYRDFIELPSVMPSFGIRFYSPDRNYADIPFAQPASDATVPAGYTCKREILDHFLMLNVKKHREISVIENFRVKTAERRGDEVVLQGESNTLRGKMVVGSDGVRSVIGSSLAGNTADYKNYSIGVRTYFKGVSDLHPENFIELHFFKELLPGYLWIFPLSDNETNVGLGILYDQFKEKKENLAEKLIRLIDRDDELRTRFRNSEMKGKIEGYGLPLGPSRKAVSGDGFLLTGDAASLVDPFTGEGIGNAMASGEIAARVIRHAFQKMDLSPEMLKEYDELIAKRFQNEQKTSHLIQKMAQSSYLFNLVISKARRNDEFRNFLSKMYTNQDIRAELANPLFYLKMVFR